MYSGCERVSMLFNTHLADTGIKSHMLNDVQCLEHAYKHRGFNELVGASASIKSSSLAHPAISNAYKIHRTYSLED